MQIPFKKINLGSSLDAIKPLIDSGYIGLGNLVYQFEKELAEYVGAKEVVAVDSCTSALFLSMIWENQKHRVSEQVSIPSMTVPLVACALHEANINFSFSGKTDWVGSMYKIEGSHVWDSAHQLTRNQYSDNFKDTFVKLCFSFYPTKTIGSADGGAIATDDTEFAEWCRKIITYGRNQSKQYGNSWDYDVEMFGYKKHWTNLQAAIALEQLRRLDSTTLKRQAVRNKYDFAFGKVTASDYLYRVNVTDQQKFIEFMKEAGIECGVHFKPLHLMTPFKSIELDDFNRQKIEIAYSHTASLPFFDSMTDEEVEFVISKAKESGMLI